jgi:hypothetical protein
VRWTLNCGAVECGLVRLLRLVATAFDLVWDRGHVVMCDRIILLCLVIRYQ